ncbi:MULTISPECIES: hypothetical protein [Brevibacillus]|uniref:Uncharacterized protein n=1 Tax=Brevibacillus thermoruber TaxID=33942 RepID=A0A9X3TTG4_9BACL|nr:MULTISPECIES: hypothetical protein [Brevibacillus]MDA5110202.1 hypothetical protein [Brevibacillus thermoruber]UYZ14642.1 hypothetical protein A6764_06705 [Brevibacillus sp. WF146]
MNAVTFYTRCQGEETSFEYNFYDNGFSPSNLAVRKVLMAMLESVRPRLTHLEVEYNDGMLADKLGARRAGDLLRFLGASKANMRETYSGDVVVSRVFRAPLTPERYDYFHTLPDVSQLSHYRLQEQEKDRIVFYFTRYLQLIAPQREAERFAARLEAYGLPYRWVPIDGED